MWNNLPVIGWVVDLVFKCSLALPFWIAWTLCGIGPKFFAFLPDVYLAPGFWEIVGVFICLGILRQFSPFRAYSSSASSVKKDHDEPMEAQ